MLGRTGLQQATSLTAAAARPFTARRCLKVLAKKTATKPAEPSTTSADVGPAGLAAIATGLVANPVMLWSEYTLKTTGAGLPPGPGGALGALEGISYLVVIGIIAWSAYSKATTGSGLPAGPSGLLGAVEGVSYLSLLGGVVVFGLTFLEKGGLPGILG
eukprot:gene6300-6535_t